MEMERFAPRDSSAVERVSYDASRRELYVVYTGGREYVYRRTPPHVFERLKAVEVGGGSVGQFVNWRIKPIYTDVCEVGRGRTQGASPDPADPHRRTHRQRQDHPGPEARR
jgi:hypothetical protein